MRPMTKKRIAAVKTADAINAIEGVPVSNYARALSKSWARGELTGAQMKDCRAGAPKPCLIHIYIKISLC